MNNLSQSVRVWSPVITPFNADLSPDPQRFAAHCRWLLDNEVGLAVFGTNSEANSLTTGEKRGLLLSLAEAGIPGERLMPGTGHCSIGDTVALTREALAVGCDKVLMLPPFYYKDVSDEGLFRYYSEVIERVGESQLRIYLYHIPPVAQVPLSLSLIERLLEAYPHSIAGIKDSGGDWQHTEALISEFSDEGFQVYAGSEHFLFDTLRAGGAGCISATANVNPGPIAELARTWQEQDADEHQASLSRLRRIFESYPMIPALKAATAMYGGDDHWFRMRPPLVDLGVAQRKGLKDALDEQDFTMQGLKTTTQN